MSKAASSIKAGLMEAVELAKSAHAKRGGKRKATLALNWRTGSGYPDHGDRTDLWGWEFLRRNPEYRADWKKFTDTADALRGDYDKPYDNLPDDWENDPGRPYWIISRANDEENTRASEFDPPINEGETEHDWRRRICAAGGRGQITPLHRAMGSRWGLDAIADPARDRLGFDFRWEISPFGVTSPGAHRHNKEVTWVWTLNDVAQMLKPDPLPPDALQNARDLLEKVPAAWEKRRTEMAEESHPERRGRFVVEFDLRVSIPEQLRHAGDWLERQQDEWRESGGEVWSTGRRNKETPGYATYLRVLDAIEEIGETDGTKLKKEIAAAMIPGYKPAAPHDERKRHIDRAATWIGRAKELRDGDYRRLVAMAVKPTLSEWESKRRK